MLVREYSPEQKPWAGFVPSSGLYYHDFSVIAIVSEEIGNKMDDELQAIKQQYRNAVKVAEQQLKSRTNELLADNGIER